MKVCILVLVLLLSIQPVYTKAWDLSDLFKTNKKKIVQHRPPSKHKRSARNDAPASATPEPYPSPHPTVVKDGQTFFLVDSDWLARYRVYEAVWDYQIPDDDRIKRDDGNYLVPVVVYRHYEDMVKTPKRN